MTDRQGHYRPDAPYKGRFARESADVRRQGLIDATARCLAEKGVGGTSVRAICAYAGVSPGLLTHYFDGVDALIHATYAHVGAQVSVAIAQAVENAGADPVDRLRAGLMANFAPPILDPALLATWIAFWSLVTSNPAIAALHASHYADGRVHLESLLRAAAPVMSITQVRLSAISLTALVDGLWLELCLDKSAFSVVEARSMVERAMLSAITL